MVESLVSMLIYPLPSSKRPTINASVVDERGVLPARSLFYKQRDGERGNKMFLHAQSISTNSLHAATNAGVHAPQAKAMGRSPARLTRVAKVMK